MELDCTFGGADAREAHHAGGPLRSGLFAPLPPVERPTSVHCHSARPQSIRFLRETLAKLSDDSIRVGRRLVGEGQSGSSRSASPQLRGERPLALPDQAGWLADWEQQRGRAQVLRVPPQGEEAAPAPELGHHEEEARRLPGECSVYDARDAMLAVARVISAWERDTSNAAKAWAEHIDRQVQHHSANNERWEAMTVQLQAIQRHMEAIDQKLVDRAASAAGFEGEQRDANSKVQTALQGLSDALEAARRRSAEQTEAVQRTVAQECQCTMEHLRSLLDDGEPSSPTAGPGAGGGASVGAHLRGLHERLGELLQAGEKEGKHWRDTAHHWHSVQQETVVGAEQARTERLEAQKEMARLETEVAQLRDDLVAAKASLEETARAPAAVALGRLQAVEKRGRVQVNRQTGQLEVLAGLEFAAVKVGPNITPEFRDPTAAGATLGDIAEVWRLFDGPVDMELQIRPGKGGKPEFWDKVAVAQAATLREEIVRAGIPELLVATKGVQAPKGADPGLQVFLKRDVFGGPAAGAPDKARGKSPGKR